MRSLERSISELELKCESCHGVIGLSIQQLVIAHHSAQGKQPTLFTSAIMRPKEAMQIACESAYGSTMMLC